VELITPLCIQLKFAIVNNVDSVARLFTLIYRESTITKLLEYDVFAVVVGHCCHSIGTNYNE